MTKAKTVAEMLLIPLDRVLPSGSNPRVTLDKDAFKELMTSIRNNGLLQPIAVRVAGDNYEIVGGHRRYHAFRELAHESPSEARFAAIPALVVDLADMRVAAARLAENINRADLSPPEIAEGIADALENMTEEELAESLGWKARNVRRYRQFHQAPAWLKAFATEVVIPKKKLDEHGAPVLDNLTDAPVHDVEKLPGLKFTHIFELLTTYSVLHDVDQLELEEHGGEKFRPQAERIIKKLARRAAQEEWSIAKLRAEAGRVKDAPPKKTPASTEATPTFAINAKRANIDFTKKLARQQRDQLAQQLTEALVAFGFDTVVIRDKVA